jgi:hypothetical protein
MREAKLSEGITLVGVGNAIASPTSFIISYLER